MVILAALLLYFSAEDVVLRRITWLGLLGWTVGCLLAYGRALSVLGAVVAFALAWCADFPGGDQKALALIGAVVGWQMIALAIALVAGLKVGLSLYSRVDVSRWPVLPAVALVIGLLGLV